MDKDRKCCFCVFLNDNLSNTGRGGTVKASKKNFFSTWLWLIKIFLHYFFFFKDLKAFEKHANCLKSLHGKFRQFASIIQMFAKDSASP